MAEQEQLTSLYQCQALIEIDTKWRQLLCKQNWRLSHIPSGSSLLLSAACHFVVSPH